MSPAGAEKIEALTEAQFLEHLRSVTERYLQTVDAWEAAHARYYRLPTVNQVSSDLVPFHNDFLAAKKALQESAPRARRLCLKYEVPFAWHALLRTELGTVAPQQVGGAAVGRGERNAVVVSLAQLHEYVNGGFTRTEQEQQPGILQRILNFFF